MRRSSSFDDAMILRKGVGGLLMTKLITVHGTNAGNPNDEGEHWWQKNSPFQKRLAEWLDLDGVVIQPFHWEEGPNSEVKRRKAGKRLFNRLRALEETDEDYYLIGHSHGGSVIYHALLAASASSHNLRGLRSWMTVGTPFVHTKPRWLFWRLGNLGKIAFVSMLAIVVVMLTMFPVQYEYGRTFFKANWKRLEIPYQVSDYLIDFYTVSNAVSLSLLGVAIFVFLLILT
jgi:hypothetical protein